MRLSIASGVAFGRDYCSGFRMSSKNDYYEGHEQEIESQHDKQINRGNCIPAESESSDRQRFPNAAKPH
jgi:hypothetical protein